MCTLFMICVCVIFLRENDLQGYKPLRHCVSAVKIFYRRDAEAQRGLMLELGLFQNAPGILHSFPGIAFKEVGYYGSEKF